MVVSASKALHQARLVYRNLPLHSIIQSSRYASSKSANNHAPAPPVKQPQMDTKSSKEDNEKAKTVAEQDEQLRLKLEGISGGGGEAGLELEDGQPVAMKRSVKENMFRLI